MMVRFDPELNGEIMEKDGVSPTAFTKRVMKGFAFFDISVLQSPRELEYWIALSLDHNKTAKSSKKRKRN